MTDSPAPESPAGPPVADREDTWEDRHGTPSHRPYQWMKDRQDPRLLPLLEAENDWCRAQLAPLDDLRDRVYEEIVARVQEDDTSPATPRGDWAYYVRTKAGVEQSIHCRVPRGDLQGAGEPAATLQGAGKQAATLQGAGKQAATLQGAGNSEQVLLDENVLAAATGYCQLGALSVAPDHGRLAYAVDVDGAERFTLKVRDLTTGEDLDDEVGPDQGRPVGHGVAWGSDSNHLYYTVQDETHRPFQVWRHVVGTPAADDVLVLEEPDEKYWMHVGRERSGDFVVIGIGSSITSEARLLDAHDPHAQPVVVAPREVGVDYDVEHRRAPGTTPGDGELWITHNADGAVDFALARVAMDDVRAGRGRQAWEEVLAHRPGTRLLGVSAFAGHLAVVERADGLPRVRVWQPWAAEDGDHRYAEPWTVDVGQDEAAVLGLGANAEWETTTLRVTVDSMVTPTETIDVDLVTQDNVLVRRKPVPGYDPDDYRTERLWAEAPDGSRVPITIARHASVQPDGTNPCHVYGYGSYEITIDPSFTPTRLPFLDRGVVYAIVHVRGGGALGRRWYEDGKFEHKPNTFTDTLACVDHLVDTGWAARDRVSLQGRSAGGLLVGATINLAPERFAAASAEVPFVDVRATMWDASIPLTVLEYDEWGDPASDPSVDEVIAGYTPTENIRDVPYPALLVTSGINDPRVAYWEPTVWVQEHRHVRSDDRPVLLRTELGAGHFGPSGRYGRWKDEAEVIAFLLHHVGAEELLDDALLDLEDA